jgi:hypothetical protein
LPIKNQKRKKGVEIFFAKPEGLDLYCTTARACASHPTFGFIFYFFGQEIFLLPPSFLFKILINRFAFLYSCGGWDKQVAEKNKAYYFQ